MSDELNCTVSGADFARAVLAVERSAAKDDSHPVLAGIQMEIVGDALTIVAADGFRLSFAQVACTLEGAEAVNFIVRHDPLVSFVKKARKAQAITISPASGGMWCFTNEKAKESSIIPAIEGTYPDWRQIANDVAGGERERLATFKARYISDAAAAAPPDAMLSIERKAGGGASAPGVMLIRDGQDEVATHIIMPMIRYSDETASAS